jgi:hypothetical protein
VSKVNAAPPQPIAADHSAPDTAAGSACLSTTPPYENLAFHKVTINVPDKNGGGGGAAVSDNDRQRHVQRNPPLRKSKVPLKYQGIKRVKSRGREESAEELQHAEKSGYSQKERPTVCSSKRIPKDNFPQIKAFSSLSLKESTLQHLRPHKQANSPYLITTVVPRKF